MMMTFEILAVVLAVAGVLLNNHLNRWCFPLWILSNGICLALHGGAGLWGLAARDLIFSALAVHGWIRWSNARRELLGSLDAISGIMKPPMN